MDEGFSKEGVDRVLAVKELGWTHISGFDLDKFTFNRYRQKLVCRVVGEWNKLGSHVVSVCQYHRCIHE